MEAYDSQLGAPTFLGLKLRSKKLQGHSQRHLGS